MTIDAGRDQQAPGAGGAVHPGDGEQPHRQRHRRLDHLEGAHGPVAEPGAHQQRQHVEPDDRLGDQHDGPQLPGLLGFGARREAEDEAQRHGIEEQGDGPPLVGPRSQVREHHRRHPQAQQHQEEGQRLIRRAQQARARGQAAQLRHPRHLREAVSPRGGQQQPGEAGQREGRHGRRDEAALRARLQHQREADHRGRARVERRAEPLRLLRFTPREEHPHRREGQPEGDAHGPAHQLALGDQPEHERAGHHQQRASQQRHRRLRRRRIKSFGELHRLRRRNRCAQRGGNACGRNGCRLEARTKLLHRPGELVDFLFELLESLLHQAPS